MKISAVFISMMIFTTAIASYASDVVTLSKTIWERNFGDADYMGAIRCQVYTLDKYKI